MQRDAVHRRRHGVLADAIMDIAAVKGIGPHRLLRLGARQVGMGQIGRAAEQIRQRFRDRVDHQLRRLPGRDVRAVRLPKRVADLRHRVGIAAGQLSIQRVVERRASASDLRRLVRSIQPRRAACPRAPIFAPVRRVRPPGSGTARAASPARRGSSATSSAPSGAPCAFSRALTVRRAEADHGAAGDQRRPVARAAPARSRRRSPRDRGRRSGSPTSLTP